MIQQYILNKQRSYLIKLDCKYSEFEMTELSMGMSNDYHEALKYGATMIRVGSALFE